MRTRKLKKITSASIEAQELSIFATYTKRQWLRAFKHSAWQPISMHILSLHNGIMTLLDWVDFIKARNKNIYKLSEAIASSLSLAGNIVGILHYFLSSNLTLSSPIFFIASMSVGLLYQGSSALINNYRSHKAPKNAVSRAHYKQKAAQNLKGLIKTAIVSVVVWPILLSPVAPIVTSLFAISSCALLVASLGWKFLSKRKKHKLKEKLNMAKPQYNKPINIINAFSAGHHKQASCETIKLPTTHRGLFHRPHRRHTISQMDADTAKAFLVQEIRLKLNQLSSKCTAKVLTQKPKAINLKLSKHAQKYQALSICYDELEKNNRNYDFKALKINKSVNQSFFLDKSDTIDLIEAIEYYFKFHRHYTQMCPKPSRACSIKSQASYL